MKPGNSTDPHKKIETSVGDTESLQIPFELFEEENETKAEIASKIRKLEAYLAKAQVRLERHGDKLDGLRSKVVGNRADISNALAANQLDPTIGESV